MNKRIFVNGEFNTEANLLDYTWLGMCLFHLPLYSVIAASGTAIKALNEKDKKEPVLEAAFFTASNLTMFGVLGVFETIFLALVAVA